LSLVLRQDLWSRIVKATIAAFLVGNTRNSDLVRLASLQSFGLGINVWPVRAASGWVPTCQDKALKCMVELGSEHHRDIARRIE
jgi:hypothetical protein